VQVRFGTDGVRGVANAQLGAEFVLALGRAAARALPAPCFIIGRDTRRSGPLLQAAMSAGLASEGVDVVDVGVLPTPGLAWLSAVRGVPAAVVSASHNPFDDNGIKIFSPGGLKLLASTEGAIEEELERFLEDPEALERPTGAGVGCLRQEPEAAQGYVDHLAGVLEGRDLAGLQVVVDCANGAASSVAPAALRSVGARVHAIACEPDGTNINDGCGSTHPEALAAEVVARRAEVGLALDGDADRLLPVDHTGAVATGDEMLALFALDLAQRRKLVGDTVVVTVMSNLGFHRAMAERGITVLETPVGDRHILEALDDRNLVLGGEQSGHIVFRELATTGDGVLTALLLLDLVRRSGRPLAELVGGAMRRVPQVLANVAVADPRLVLAAEEVRDALSAVEGSLRGSGRVLLRASGTEPLVRVMVEATEERAALAAVERLRRAVEMAGAEDRRPTGEAGTRPTSR
jgi:phosphoglucosamine mutase